jgi:hypothetical protein
MRLAVVIPSLVVLSLAAASAYAQVRGCPAGQAIQGVDFLARTLVCIPVVAPSALNAEIAARTATDALLQKNIDAEAAARAQGNSETLSSANAYTNTKAGGPTITTKSGTALLHLLEGAAGDVPGLAHTITLSTAGVMYYSTDGSLVLGSGGAEDTALVLVEVAVNNTVVHSRSFKLTNNGTPVRGADSWSLAQKVDLAPGTHVINVRAAVLFGSDVFASGVGNIFSGKLTTVLFQ